ncbi:MAG: DNA-binding protein WhiA [Firmicutes bacterium]|nr:DNA-binding protein WhiA [Bacillota bacterium]
MSFASETKNELARFTPEKKCCMLAEISGFMRFAGSVVLAGLGKFKIEMITPNLAIVRHYKTLIKQYFGVDITIGSRAAEGFGKGTEYALIIGPQENSEMILREAGVLIVKEGFNTISDGIFDGLIRTKCCRKAYLRGAFMAAGTVAAPEKKGHHFEIFARTEHQAKDLRRMINTFDDINAKIVERKQGYGVYLKSREQITDILAIMGADQQRKDYLGEMEKRDLITKAHRAENLDNANIDKAIRAAQQQLEWIKKIEETVGLDYLTPKLREIADIRMEYPELGIEELGKTMEPPLTKSGVNNRLRRIGEIAKNL